MKLPKEVRRYCPYCKKHTIHKVTNQKNKSKGSAHPLSYGGKHKVRKRGLWRGHGNLGRYSKPSKPKLSGKKTSKKTDLRYQCKECHKIHTQKTGFRVKRLEFV